MKPIGTADPAVSIAEAIFEPKFPLGPARLWSRGVLIRRGIVLRSVMLLRLSMPS